MRKELIAFKDDKGLNIKVGEGFVQKGHVFPYVDPVVFIKAIAQLLDIGDVCIIKGRYRREK